MSAAASAECTCGFHAPEEHGPDGCVVCREKGKVCKWDGRFEPKAAEPKVRRFIVWAVVSHAEQTVEMPAGATDDECEEACQAALDTLIGNGDTGWNELDEDGNES